MNPELSELASYVGLGRTDRRLLAALWPVVEPHVPRILDHFYETAQRFDGTRRVLHDPAQVARLKVTLGVWLQELLCGPHDAAYRERRLRVGRRHVEVGLDSSYMYTASQVIADDLAAIAAEALPPAEAAATMAAVHRGLTVDLALMTSSFVESRERRTALELQELLVQQLRITVLLADRDGRVSVATRGTLDVFGAEVVGQAWERVVPEVLRKAAQLDQHVQRALAEGVDTTVPRVDVTIGGTERHFSVTVVPLSHPAAAFLLQIEDLTEAVSLEGRLRRTETLAKLGALSAAVAHELRNPLAGISGALQVISRSIPPSAPYAPIMVKIDAEIRRLDRLVSDLLVFARPTTVQLEPLDLGGAVRRTLDLVRAEHPKFSITARGSGRASADADLVHQILLNLVQNAIHAVQEGAAPGRVELAIEDGAIAVSDTGPGVPDDVLPHVFEPFFTTKTRGTGLGLSVCQRFAEGMGGAVELSPRGPLGGATFTLRLQTPG
ncbi:MAG: protoglobin domain-containing protein [Myxococcota bacterium]